MQGEMTEPLYESSRYFKVWHYTVSHCRLLLRSTTNRVGENRIDLHFGGVQYMLLRPYYDGISIRRGGDIERQMLFDQYGVRADKGTLHVLGPGLSSFVIAGPLQWHEDDADMDHPSWFGKMLETP